MDTNSELKKKVRLRNSKAAVRYRQRRKQYQEWLDRTYKKQLEKNQKLKAEVESLELRIRGLRDLLSKFVKNGRNN